MNRAGFTLLELSIVIVIIGLIVAGISAGQGLVKQANLRKIISDVDATRVAVNSFKLQYSQLPGDMSNAQDYWSTVTTNGNGDKRYVAGEELYAFEHMQLAEISPFTVTFYTSTGSYGTRDTNGNVPISPLGSNGISGATFYSLHNGTSIVDVDPTIPILYLTAVNTGSAVENAGAAISPVDAFNLDKKLDDGIAYEGRVKGWDASGDSGIHDDACSYSWWTSGSISYRISSSEANNIHCFMGFIL